MTQKQAERWMNGVMHSFHSVLIERAVNLGLSRFLQLSDRNVDFRGAFLMTQPAGNLEILNCEDNGAPHSMHSRNNSPT